MRVMGVARRGGGFNPPRNVSIPMILFTHLIFIIILWLKGHSHFIILNQILSPPPLRKYNLTTPVMYVGINLGVFQ